MKYRITCLSPVLVGDGQRLAPIDYMVWKDHVNVLDQRRIFKLLAKGPRLDGYLAQLKKSERLDFASWGGFAQNFAGRRIPFEHASSIPTWEKALAQNLFIPTFAATHQGPYLPGTAIKGALRSGVVSERWSAKTMEEIGRRLREDRPPRNPGTAAEQAVLGGQKNPLKQVGAGDSKAGSYTGMRVHLIRVATLAARGQGRLELAWKTSRGHGRLEESTPMFVEMAVAGTTFEGSWQEKSGEDRSKIFAAANRFAASQVARHREFAQAALPQLTPGLNDIFEQVTEASGRQDACVLCLGWGGGLVSKAATDTSAEPFRQVARELPYYQSAIQTGLPFPKTRKVVFEKGQPARIPGWIRMEVY